MFRADAVKFKNIPRLMAIMLAANPIQSKLEIQPAV